MPGVMNTVTQKHYKASDDNTIVVNQQEFQFTGIPKIIWFFKPTGFSPDDFQSRTRMYLEAFKLFIEAK